MSAPATFARSYRIRTRRKVLPRRSVLSVLRARARRGDRIVFTNGVFDIIHAGHTRYLQAARRLGDCLVVAINSDTSARHLKGPGRPIVPERDRAEVLAALECVDYVTVFRETTPARLIGAISPNVLAKGADWKIGKIVGRDIVRATGGRIVRIPLAKGRSTTSIVERILGRRPPRSRLK